jgi:hypothetical protein
MAIRLSIGVIKVKVGRGVLAGKDVSVGRRGACVGKGVASSVTPAFGLQEANKRISKIISIDASSWKPGFRVFMFISGV